MKLMELMNIINAWIVIIGVPSMVAASIFIGRKLQVLDDLRDTLNNRILPKLDEIEARLTRLEIRVAIIEKNMDVIWAWFSKNIIGSTKPDVVLGKEV